MTDDTTNAADASLSECDNERSERNHYFHGKLMTARDMAAEQRYHAGQRRAHARNVSGAGVAWGLDASVRTDDDSLTVTVEDGYAVDECGRPVVVSQDREKTVTDPDVVGASAVTVSLSYEACLKESVPVSGAESACEDECAYNRVLEVYEINVTPGTPSGVQKPVPDVTFPTRDQLDTVTDREAPEPGDAGLATIAHSYRTNAGHESADPETTTVFVGAFEDVGNPEYDRVDDLPTAYLYPNDMLYAATARHAADFENPHQITLETETPEDGDGARIYVLNDESEAPDVTVDSGDGTVAVDHQAGAQRIDLSVKDYVEGEIEELRERLTERIDDLEAELTEMQRQQARHSLAFKRQAFRHVEACFGSDGAAEVREATDTAIEDGVHEDPDAYVERLGLLRDMEAELDLGDQVRDCDLETYEGAVQRLSELLERRAAGEDVPLMQLVSAQNRVSEAAGWMDPKDTDEEEEAPASGSFVESVYTENRGDVATMEISLRNTDTATLVVGSDEVNYRSRVVLEDGNGDGTVTVRMNTFLAGRVPGEESRAFGTAADADGANATLEIPEDEGLPSPLGATDYDLHLLVGGTEQAVASLQLTDRSTDDLTVYQAPADEFGSLDGVESIEKARDMGRLTETHEMAIGDTLVHEIAASGLVGAIADASGSDATSVAAGGVADILGDVANLVVREGAEEPKRLDIGASLEGDVMRFVIDEAGDRLFAVLDSDDAIFRRGDGTEQLSAAAGEDYVAEFIVLGNGPLADTDERVGNEFAFVEATASFDTGNSESVSVSPESGQVIGGTTSLAPGTELTIRARSTGDNSFLKSATTTVTDDGIFEGTFDFSGIPVETSFTVTLQGVRVSAEASGEVVSSS